MKSGFLLATCLFIVYLKFQSKSQKETNMYKIRICTDRIGISPKTLAYSLLSS